MYNFVRTTCIPKAGIELIFHYDRLGEDKLATEGTK